MNRVVFFQVSQLPLLMAVRSMRHALSMHTKFGRDSSVGKTVPKKLMMFVGDSDLENLAQAITTPHGAQIVSTQ